MPPWQFPDWLTSQKTFVRYADNFTFVTRGSAKLFGSIIQRELDDRCYLVMLDPDPEEYAAAYGALPILRFDWPVTDEEFWIKTTTDPSGGMFGMAMLSEIMVIFGEKPSWLIYYQRSLSMAMLVTSFDPDSLIEVNSDWWYPFEFVRDQVPPGSPIYGDLGPINVR